MAFLEIFTSVFSEQTRNIYVAKNSKSTNTLKYTDELIKHEFEKKRNKLHVWLDFLLILHIQEEDYFPSLLYAFFFFLTSQFQENTI